MYGLGDGVSRRNPLRHIAVRLSRAGGSITHFSIERNVIGCKLPIVVVVAIVVAIVVVIVFGIEGTKMIGYDPLYVCHPNKLRSEVIIALGRLRQR